MDSIVLLIAFGVIYFMMIRPHKATTKGNHIDSLQVNDKIVTIGGIQMVLSFKRII